MQRLSSIMIKDATPHALAASPAGECILCHTIDPAVTSDRLAAGGYWRCARCGQMWDFARLDAAAAHGRYVATHDVIGAV
jgi:hypothetical protein